MTDPRVSDERLDVIERCIIGSGASQSRPDRRLMTDNCTLDLISDVRGARAKVAELEALRKAENASWDAAERNVEQLEVALARAAEALSRFRAFVHYGCSCGEGTTDGRCTRMNAQGSAAQKPEGPRTT